MYDILKAIGLKTGKKKLEPIRIWQNDIKLGIVVD
jgi:hypothetical protein